MFNVFHSIHGKIASSSYVVIGLVKNCIGKNENDKKGQKIT